MELGSSKLTNTKGIFMALDASTMDSTIADALIIEHYLGFTADNVRNLLPPLGTMGNDAKKKNGTTDELVADDSTYKFLNSEGQFIPEHCKGSSTPCLEIYATDPYATFRLGLVEEMLQNIETRQGLKLNVALTYAHEDAIDAIIKHEQAKESFAFVSCIHCPLVMKNKAISNFVKFPDQTNECDQQLTS